MSFWWPCCVAPEDQDIVETLPPLQVSALTQRSVPSLQLSGLPQKLFEHTQVGAHGGDEAKGESSLIDAAYALSAAIVEQLETDEVAPVLLGQTRQMLEREEMQSMTMAKMPTISERCSPSGEAEAAEEWKTRPYQRSS